MKNPKAIAKLVGASAQTRAIGFVLSTSVEDRTNDTISVSGWHLENYRKNPVVLWGHMQNTPPVGKCIEIGVTTRGLEATIQFATADEYPLADTVYKLLKGGYLNAGSVGFRPMKHVYNHDTGGIDFTEQELLEFSVVSVPCNPEALVSAKSAGIDLAPIVKTLTVATSETFTELRAALSLSESVAKAAQAASLLGLLNNRAKHNAARIRLA